LGWCRNLLDCHAGARRRSELRRYSENTVSSFAADSLTLSRAPFYPNCSSLEYLHLLSCFCGLRGTSWGAEDQNALRNPRIGNPCD
jgi:hypothetical protein